MRVVPVLRVIKERYTAPMMLRWGGFLLALTWVSAGTGCLLDREGSGESDGGPAEAEASPSDADAEAAIDADGEPPVDADGEPPLDADQAVPDADLAPDADEVLTPAIAAVEPNVGVTCGGRADPRAEAVETIEITLTGVDYQAGTSVTIGEALVTETCTSCPGCDACIVGTGPTETGFWLTLRYPPSDHVGEAPIAVAVGGETLVWDDVFTYTTLPLRLEVISETLASSSAAVATGAFVTGTDGAEQAVVGLEAVNSAGLARLVSFRGGTLTLDGWSGPVDRTVENALAVDRPDMLGRIESPRELATRSGNRLIATEVSSGAFSTTAFASCTLSNMVAFGAGPLGSTEGSHLVAIRETSAGSFTLHTLALRGGSGSACTGLSTARSTFNAASGSIGAVIVEDLNGDDFGDVAFTAKVDDGDSPGVLVLWGQGNGAFSNGSAPQRIDLAAGDGCAEPRALVVTELDGDSAGRPDLLVGCADTGNLQVLHGSELGTIRTFEPGPPIALSGMTRADLIALADIHLDGIDDVVACGRGTRECRILEGQGLLPAFVESAVTPTITDSGAEILSLGVGDLSGDGQDDLVLTGADGSSGAVWVVRSWDPTP